MYINGKEYIDHKLGFQDMQALHKRLYAKMYAQRMEWKPFRMRELPWGTPDIIILMDGQLKFKYLWNVIACFTEYVPPHECLKIPFDKSRIIIKNEKDDKFICDLYEKLYYMRTIEPAYIFKLSLMSEGQETDDSILLPILVKPEVVDIHDEYFKTDWFICDLISSPTQPLFITTDDLGNIISHHSETPVEFWQRFSKRLPSKPTAPYCDRCDMLVTCDSKIDCKAFISFFESARYVPAQKTNTFDFINILVLFYPNEKNDKECISRNYQ